MPAFFLLCLQIARFPLCLCLALQKLRWAHIKLRHFHSEHEFSIIIKTEKAHRLTMFGDARFGAYMWITPTPCVRAANYYFQTHTKSHTAFFPHHIEFAFFRVCVCVYFVMSTPRNMLTVEENNHSTAHTYSQKLTENVPQVSVY